MVRNVNNTCSTHDAAGIRYDPIVLIDYDDIANSIASSEMTTPPTEATTGTTFTERDLMAWRDCRNVALSTLEEELRTYFFSYQQRHSIEPIDNDNNTSLLIILDDNFHLRSMRRDAYKVCQRVISDIAIKSQSANSTCLLFSIGFSVLMIGTPLNICLKRNALRQGKAQISEVTIRKMASTLEMPVPNSGDYMKKFEMNSFLIDYSEDHTGKLQDADDLYSFFGDAVRACLEAARRNPVIPPQREEEVDPEILQRAREQTKKSQIHQADRLLRNLVGEIGRADKSMGRVANDARKYVLQQVRDETIIVKTNDDEDTDCALEVSIANAFRSYLENDLCQSGSSSLLPTMDAALLRLKYADPK